MNVSAIQVVIPAAPSTLDQTASPPVRNGSSFQTHLDQAINQGGPPSNSPTSPSADPSPAPGNQDGKNTKGAKTQDQSASLVAPAAVGSNGNTVAPAAAPGQHTPPASQVAAGSQDASTGVSSVVVTLTAPSAQSSGSPDASRFAWLTAMLPDAGISSKFPVSVGIAAPASQGDTVTRIEDFLAKKLPAANPGNEAANPPGDQPAVSPATATRLPVETLVNGADVGAAESLATPDASTTSGPSQGASPDAAPGAVGNAPPSGVALGVKGNTPPPGMAPSFERVGVSIISVSTAASGSSAPPALQASVTRVQPPNHRSAALATANLHPPNSSDIAAQSVRDAGIASAAPGQTGASHDASPNAVKPADGSSGDGAKNSNAQDTNGKFQSAPQGGSGSNAATVGGAAAAASSAVQAASSGFPLALTQAAQGASGTARAATPAQPGGLPQATASKVAAAMDTPSNLPSGVVNAASMIQTQGRAEMRVAVQTDAMGTLQLHAVLDNGKLGASIAVVSHEAHTLLTSELPALQQVLSDQNLRVDRLAVINSSAMTGGSAGNNPGFHSGDSDQPRNLAPRWVSDAPAQVAAAAGKETIVQEDLRRRLSVRA